MALVLIFVAIVLLRKAAGTRTRQTLPRVVRTQNPNASHVQNGPLVPSAPPEVYVAEPMTKYPGPSSKIREV